MFVGLSAESWTAIGTIVTAIGATGTLVVAVIGSSVREGQLDSAKQQLDVM